IEDVAGLLAKFRALDLDPRRAEQRKREEQAREQAAAVRKEGALAELDRTARGEWPALAWKWLGGRGPARPLLRRLAAEPQNAALDDLRALDDQEREVALPRLAGELSPELEAILVGSLVRDDGLEGVLKKPTGGGGDPEALGWDAIDAALEPTYKGVEP